jgi:hypothetical protein
MVSSFPSSILLLSKELRFERGHPPIFFEGTELQGMDDLGTVGDFWIAFYDVQLAILNCFATTEKIGFFWVYSLRPILD